MELGDPLALMDLPEHQVASRLRAPQAAAWRAARDAFRARDDGRLAAAAQVLGAGATLAVRGSPGYPRALAGLDAAPMLLFMAGARLAEALQRPCVAVVGTREPSAYGLEVTRRLVAGLVAAGVTVVSGAALGIDTCAHQSALEAGGLTVAALGVPLMSPEGNAALRQRVVTQGGCVSEAVPGADAHAGRFPQRNRLISGLSAVTVVVEGGTGSGAGITADWARKQGRVVMAVPGDITRPQSATPLQLIKEGAGLVTGVAVVLKALGLQPVDGQDALPERVAGERGAGPEVGEALAPLLAALVPGRLVDLDEVVAASGRSAAEVARGLLELELKGLCRRGPGGAYARAG
jgi:DNA processing protein